MSTKSKNMTTSAKRAPRMNTSECPMCLIHAKGDRATQVEITRLRGARVYVVIEEDRGLGPGVSGVYDSEAAAAAACGNNETVSGPHDLQRAEGT